MRGGTTSGGASLVEVGGLAWCLGVAGSGWEWPGWRGRGLGGAALLGVFVVGVLVLDQGETGGQLGVLEGMKRRQGVREWWLGKGWLRTGMEGG